MKPNFLEKYEALKKSVPIPAVVVSNNENCRLVDYTHHSKNCYHCFQAWDLENGTYCQECAGRDLVDCDLIVFSELCYQCDRLVNCYCCTYSRDCHQCRNCHFCVMCVSCRHCFGCVALTHKQYCIFNKQYSETEYEQRLRELKKKRSEELLEQLQALLRKTPCPSSHQRNTVNCPYGDFINNSKDSYWCFDTLNLENCGYVFKGGVAKDCWDMTIAGGGGGKKAVEEMVASELCYEIVGGGGNYHCAFLERSSNNTNCYYGKELHRCTDCFGCVGLTNKRYCVLNNQLTKEEYQKAVKVIKKELGWQ